MSFFTESADGALCLAAHCLAAAGVAVVVWRSSRRISRPIGRSMFRALGAVPVLREWHGRVKDHPQELDDVQTTMSLLFSLAMCFVNAITHCFWAVDKVAELPAPVVENGGTYFAVILYTLQGVLQGWLTIAFISGALKVFRRD